MTKTSKQERKYGKKGDDNEALMEVERDIPVKVMVDHSYIMRFKNRQEADSYIESAQKQAKSRGQVPISFEFI